MITIKLEGVEQARKAYDPKIVNRAARMAMNEAARQARTAALKSIRVEQGYNIKASDLRQKLRITSKASIADLTAELTATGRPISLAYFGAKEVRDIGRGRVLTQTRTSGRIVKRTKAKRGVTVKIKRGKTTHMKDAFMSSVAAISKGELVGYHVGVFRRLTRKRLPIMEKAVVTIASMFGNSNTQAAITKAVEDTWRKRFDYHIKRLIG